MSTVHREADSDLDGSVYPAEAAPFTEFTAIVHGAYLAKGRPCAPRTGAV